MLGVTTNVVAAAANLLLSPQTHAMFSVAGQLTRDIMLNALMCIWTHLQTTQFPGQCVLLDAVLLPVCSPCQSVTAVTGMLSPDGRCKTLDAAAEGYVRAEAVGAVWLRCLKSVAGLTLGPNKPVSMVPPSFDWT